MPIRMMVSMDELELFVVAPSSDHQSADALVFRYGTDLKDRSESYVVVVDSGRRASTGGQIQEVVQSIFETDKIDLVVSSHADQDHAGGIPHLLNNLEVGEVWIHRPQDHRPAIDEPAVSASIRHVNDILGAAKHREVPTKEPFSEFVDHGFEGLHILGPSQAYYENLMSRGMYEKEELDLLDDWESSVQASLEAQDSSLLPNPTTSLRNSSSTILLLKLESKQLLLTGDAGVEAFESARPIFDESGYNPADAIVQIPHHGSRKSLNPATADLLLGENSGERRAFVTAAIEDQHGFPHVEITDEFIRRGRKIPKPRSGTNLRYQHNCRFPRPNGYEPLQDDRYIAPSWEPVSEDA